MKRLRLQIKLLVILLFLAFITYDITVRVSQGTAESFEVHGVDVSSYQGDIDWEELSQCGISFAFIKATEGSGYTDRYFAKNIEGARKTNLRIGAYHFFSFESGGKEQAQNFISVVPKYDDMLPPAIDLEFYGEHEKTPPDREEVCRNLDVLVGELYEHYGKKTIIYTTRKTYLMYIAGRYSDCDIWICDIVKKPTLPDGRRWTFWQHSHTGLLSGYSGEEKYIDLNVFCGTYEEFLKYGR